MFLTDRWYWGAYYLSAVDALKKKKERKENGLLKQ